MLKRITAAFTALCLAVGLVPLPAFAAGGNPATAASGGAGGLVAAAVGGAGTFYVATNGNAGTIDAPFAAIKHAADVMKSGDTCYIREGTYRELLSDHQRIDSNGSIASHTIRKLLGTEAAPFTFQAYPGEKVTLTGCDPVTGWTQVEGLPNIWQAEMDWDMYLGKTLGSGTPLPEGQEEGIANGTSCSLGARPASRAAGRTPTPMRPRPPHAASPTRSWTSTATRGPMRARVP